MQQIVKNLLVISALGLLITACGTSRKTTTQQKVPQTVQILAVNDMHATIDHFPRLAFIIDSLRAIYPDMLLVSAGDNQTGNPVNDQYQPKGRPMIELMNDVRFDLSAVGNHEFDTKGAFAENREVAAFDFICSNLTQAEDGSEQIKPYKIISLPNGLKIVFASVLHINSGGIPDTHPENVQGFNFQPPIEVAQALTHLRDSGNVFVLINHIGYESDVEVANALPTQSVDIIIGGHSHTRVDKEQIHNGILITQAENKLKYATLLHVTVDADGTLHRSMQLLSVGKQGSENPDIRTKVNEYNSNSWLTEKIAEATDNFSSYDEVGYLMVDALRVATEADIALINPGGVRIDHLPQGDVCVMDVYSMDPFGNEVVLFKLTGHEIRSLMLCAFELDDRLPIYPSGIASSYTLAGDGSILDVQLFTTKGDPLDMSQTYTVVMNNFMASIYTYEHEDAGTSLFRPTAESMIEYLRRLKQIPSYKGEKRVTINN